jgi:Ca-activated chloride channel homolog
MRGRHRSDPPRHGHEGGRRDGRPGGSRGAVVAVVLAVLAAGTAATLAERADLLGCLSSRTSLEVVAPPDIAPALRQIEDRFERGDLGQNGRCVSVEMVERESWQVAAEMAPSRIPPSAAESAPTVSSPPATRADVWVADSSLWVDRVRTLASAEAPSQAVSIAHSPAVVALPRPIADRLGWPNATIGWRDVITPRPGAPALRMQVVDPLRSAATLGALVALRDVTVGRGGDAAAIGAIHALSTNAAPSDEQLLQRLPRTAADLADPAHAGPQAFAYSEQGVWRYNASSPGVPLAAFYLAEGSATLDFPYATMPPASRSERKQRAARDFLRAIQDEGGRRILQTHAFRTVADEAGPAVSPLNGLRSEKPANAFLPPPTAVERTIRMWSALKYPARILSVFDVSGSMLKVDPPAVKSRIELTREATAQGFSLLSNDSDVGLWIFSTDLTPTADYRQLLEIGRMDSKIGGVTHGDKLKVLLRGLTAKKGGATGLYDTALAAYQEMTRTYDPNKSNTIVLFTDGKNEDDRSITLSQLVAELKKLHNPRRPIRIFTIGYGTEVDGPALRSIAEATEGKAFVSTDPSSVLQVFVEGMALLACDPQECAHPAPQ